MADALKGFTLGFAVVAVLVAVWKARGMWQELLRTQDAHRHEIERLSQWVEKHRADIFSLQSTHGGIGAADAALAQLAGRISRIEKQTAEMDLSILDTAEKVAARLQDRQRKRRQAEVPDEDHDEIPDDPNLLLAYARQQYGVIPGPTSSDDAQLPIPGVN